MERRSSSAASLELSAASRADWVVAGKSAALIAARASSENLTNDSSLPVIHSSRTSSARSAQLSSQRTSASRSSGLVDHFVHHALHVGEEPVAPVKALWDSGNDVPETLQRRLRAIQDVRQPLFHGCKWRRHRRHVGPIRFEPKFNRLWGDSPANRATSTPPRLMGCP